MQSNDLEVLGKRCFYFLSHSEVKVMTRFDVFFDLVILPYFNAMSIYCYAVKCFICIYLSNLNVCEWENAYITTPLSKRFFISL